LQLVTTEPAVVPLGKGITTWYPSDVVRPMKATQ